MADKKFTLFEFHLSDASVQFGPRSIGTDAVDEPLAELTGDGDADDTAAEDATDDDDGGSGGSGLGALLGLGLLALGAFVAKKLLGGDDFEELDDIETFDASAVDDDAADETAEGDEGVTIDIEDEGTGSGGKLAALAVLGLLALVAVAVKKLLGAGEGLEELDDLAED